LPKVSDAGQVQGTDRKYQIMHNGIKTYTDSHYGDFNIEIIEKLKGIHEPQEEKVFYEILKTIPEGATMLELGSFWAYYSMWFNKEIAGAKNYLIEPVEFMMHKGMDNFELNGMKGDFNLACIGEQSYDEVDFIDWDKSVRKVKQVCIDDFLENKEISYLDILHSDIQGAEYSMLQGAKKSFDKNRIGYLFISTHSESIHQNCLDFIQNHNFDIVSEHNLAESYSTDGLIVAAHTSEKCKKIDISKRVEKSGFLTSLKKIFK